MAPSAKQRGKRSKIRVLDDALPIEEPPATDRVDQTVMTPDPDTDEESNPWSLLPYNADDDDPGMRQKTKLRKAWQDVIEELHEDFTEKLKVEKE